MATSPIHEACARRADATGCLSQAAVHEVFAEPGFANVAGGKRIALRDKRLASVAEACGVPFVCDPFGGANQHGGRKPFRLEHVLYLIWDQVVKVMDDVGAQSTRAEETPVAASAQSLVLATVATVV